MNASPPKIDDYSSLYLVEINESYFYDIDVLFLVPATQFYFRTFWNKLSNLFPIQISRLRLKKRDSHDPFSSEPAPATGKSNVKDSLSPLSAPSYLLTGRSGQSTSDSLKLLTFSFSCRPIGTLFYHLPSPCGGNTWGTVLGPSPSCLWWSYTWPAPPEVRAPAQSCPGSPSSPSLLCQSHPHHFLPDKTNNISVPGKVK